MAVTDVEYTILLARSFDEASQSRLAQYDRQAQSLDTDGSGLFEFVCRYLEQLPVSLRTARTAADQASLSDIIEPVIQSVENFFDRHDELSRSGGLLGLLDRAYLGHRLLEELNDQLHIRLNYLLLHVDMTEANTLVHRLIGEPYASELEGVVNQTTDNLLATLRNRPACVSDHQPAALIPFLDQATLRLRLRH